MKNSRWIVIGIVAFLLVLFAVSGIVLLLSNQPEKNIAISYSMVTKQSFVWINANGSSYEKQPDSGKVFLEVNMTIKNNGYSSFDTNPLYFYVVASNVTYSFDEATFLVSGETVDVLRGETFKGALIFQVPKSDNSFTLGFERPFTNYTIVWTKT